MKPSANRRRLKFPPISEEMRAWSAALEAEAQSWPQVSSRVFFGFTALYRRDTIFALLPRTRSIDQPNTLAFKFESVPPRLVRRLQVDSRVGNTEMRAARWQTFELSSDADLHDALHWLENAHQAAGKSKKSK